MNPGESLPVGQHDLEIQANRLAWQRKAQLRAVYRGFHELIASRLDRSVPGQVVELGSGMGSIKEVIPDCVTTDLFPNPWLDRQENAYRLSFADGERLEPHPLRRLAPPALPGDGPRRSSAGCWRPAAA